MKIPENLKWKATGKTLGAGGQGEVFEVVDKTEDSGRTYALKALRKGRSDAAYKRFYREVAAVKSLDHPNILRIIDHSDANAEFHYYVTELLPNAMPLGVLIKSEENPYCQDPLMALDLFRQIISAVAACEATRVVHRDLSPDNILVLPDGTIKVIDFGLCQIEGQQPVTLVDEGVGTINYMAPECESGAEGRESTASDVYSAGKILWSAITGQKAFAREAPVFGNKSMKTLFANSPETWHLNVIFERTIRPRPDDRDSPQHLLWLTDTVRRLILAGRPPLELILRRCTACGLGDLVEDRHGHLLFANPPPKGVVYVHCNYCGYCFAVRRNVIQENLTKRTARD